MVSIFSSTDLRFRFVFVSNLCFNFVVSGILVTEMPDRLCGWSSIGKETKRERGLIAGVEAMSSILFTEVED